MEDLVCWYSSKEVSEGFYSCRVRHVVKLEVMLSDCQQMAN